MGVRLSPPSVLAATAQLCLPGGQRVLPTPGLSPQSPSMFLDTGSFLIKQSPALRQVAPSLPWLCQLSLNYPRIFVQGCMSSDSWRCLNRGARYYVWHTVKEGRGHITAVYGSLITEYRPSRKADTHASEPEMSQLIRTMCLGHQISHCLSTSISSFTTPIPKAYFVLAHWELPDFLGCKLSMSFVNK